MYTSPLIFDEYKCSCCICTSTCFHFSQRCFGVTGAIWVAAILTECDSAPSHLGKVPQTLPPPLGGLLLLFFIVRWCVNVFS